MIFFPKPKIINRELKIISIKNFYIVNPFQRKKINEIIEKNRLFFPKNLVDHNYPIIEEEINFFSKLQDKFLKVSKKIFNQITLSDERVRFCYCYNSSLTDYVSIYHDHTKTCTINSVYYYQVSKGDSITFLMEDGNEFTYFPIQGELLIFPSTLIHKPNKPSTNKKRYSLNMELFTLESADQLFSII
jgi:hypothetical protein